MSSFVPSLFPNVFSLHLPMTFCCHRIGINRSWLPQDYLYFLFCFQKNLRQFGTCINYSAAVTETLQYTQVMVVINIFITHTLCLTALIYVCVYVLSHLMLTRTLWVGISILWMTKLRPKSYVTCLMRNSQKVGEPDFEFRNSTIQSPESFCCALGEKSLPSLHPIPHFHIQPEYKQMIPGQQISVVLGHQRMFSLSPMIKLCAH